MEKNMAKLKMENRKVNGWRFEFVNQGDWKFYQCRGMVMHDDDHDEMPEPSLWQAALVLEKQLFDEGIKSEAGHSEKGWVEVTIN